MEARVECVGFIMHLECVSVILYQKAWSGDPFLVLVTKAFQGWSSGLVVLQNT